MKKLLPIAAFLVAGFWQYDQNRVVEQADGVIAKAAPIQTVAPVSWYG